MRLTSRNFRSWVLVTVSSFLLGSCSKSDQHNPSASADIRQFSLFPGQDHTVLDESNHMVTIRVADTVASGIQLAASYTLSSGASLTLNGIVQESGITQNDFENDLRYTVTAVDQQTRQKWIVRASNNDYSLPWGLGHFVKSAYTSNRSYNWYIDQSGSGTYALVNCGPASVTMAIKWADSTFTKTALDARQTYEPAGGWWYTPDIDHYLTDNQVEHAIIGLSPDKANNRDILTQQLDHQQIIILCLDMNYVRYTSDSTERVDKFYPTTPQWGHFIVLKGYYKVDNETFFEVYDPYSFGRVNADNSLKGINRYYRYEDLSDATQFWWSYAFVIAKKGATLDTDAMNRKLNPRTVPVSHGGNPVF